MITFGSEQQVRQLTELTAQLERSHIEQVAEAIDKKVKPDAEMVLVIRINDSEGSVAKIFTHRRGPGWRLQNISGSWSTTDIVRNYGKRAVQLHADADVITLWVKAG